MTLGLVEPTRITTRRDNPRRMSEQEYETLKRSLSRFGMQGFVVVEQKEPGQFAIVDGHHREKALIDLGKERVPIIVMPAEVSTKEWLDLAMLTFNVTGDPIEDKFIDLLSELTQTLGPEITSEYTAIEVGFLQNFKAQYEETLTQLQEQQKAAEATESDRASSSQGKALIVEFPRIDDVQEILDKVCSLTGEQVVGQAVLKALREWVAVAEKLRRRPVTLKADNGVQDQAGDTHGEGDEAPVPS